MISRKLFRLGEDEIAQGAHALKMFAIISDADVHNGLGRINVPLRSNPRVQEKMGLRWWRYVLIRNQTKRYLDDRQARKYWFVSFRKNR
jgi:hypothetical protein